MFVCLFSFLFIRVFVLSFLPACLLAGGVLFLWPLARSLRPLPAGLSGSVKGRPVVSFLPDC